MEISLLHQKIFSSTGLRLAGKVIQVILGILAVRWLTSHLGAELYGAYGKMMELSLFLASWVNLGIPNHATRLLSEEEASSHTVKDVIVLRIWTALAVFGIAGIIWQWSHPEWIFSSGVGLLISALFFDQIHAIVEASLQARYKMKWALLATLCGRSLNLFGIWILIRWNIHDPNLFALTPLLASLGTLSIGGIGLWKEWTLRRGDLLGSWTFKWSVQKKLLLASLPVGIISSLNLIYFRFGISEIAATNLPNEGFALYNTGWDIAGNLSLISTFFMLAVLPGLHHAIHNETRKDAKKIVHFAGMIITLLAIGLIVVGIPLAPWGLAVISGETFNESAYFILIPALMLLAAVSYFYDLALISIFALGLERRWLMMELLMVGLFLGAQNLLKDGLLASPTWVEDPASGLNVTLSTIGLGILCEICISLWGLSKVQKTLSKKLPSQEKIC